MVHRLNIFQLILIILCGVMGLSAHADMREDAIRAQAEAMFMKDGTIARRSAESHLIARLMQTNAKKASYIHIPEIPDVQAFTGMHLPFQYALQLLSLSMGYGQPYVQPGIDMNQRVTLSREFKSADEHLARLQQQTHTVINVFPSSHTITVVANTQKDHR